MAVTLFLNLLGYFINDFIDVDVDLASENKDHAKALFIKQNKRTAFALIACMSAALIIPTLFYSKSVCFGVIMLLLIVTIYTEHFKNKAYWDVVFIGLWGFALSWLAIPDFSWHGIQLILLLFIFGCCFEGVQTVKDYEDDKKYGLTTTPIVIGIPRTFLLLRILYVFSGIYSILILQELAGILLIIPVFFSSRQNMSNYWLKLKITCGIVWIIIMVRLYFGY
jgi:4-hydroxybenzoate polyprenyltransferase